MVSGAALKTDPARILALPGLNLLRLRGNGPRGLVLVGGGSGAVGDRLLDELLEGDFGFADFDFVALLEVHLLSLGQHLPDAAVIGEPRAFKQFAYGDPVFVFEFESVEREDTGVLIVLW